MNAYKISRIILALFLALALILPGKSPLAKSKIKVVTTLSSYAAIAKEIGGDRVVVDHIAAGNQDAHFVPPKPSYALKLKDADLFVTTGLDLEMWAPTLIDKSRNPRIVEGAIGYVSASHGVKMLEVPTSNPDRSAGDIHIYGNPHIHTSPVNAIVISENIMIGLQKVDPQYADYYEKRQKLFAARIDSAMYGKELVELLGSDLLHELTLSGTLIEFLQQKRIGGIPLIEKLGGWMKKALPLRDQKVIAYHKNWSYFARDFGLQIIDYVEPKPGIPPSAKHVKEVIDEIKAHNIKVLMVANYFEKSTPKKIQSKTGIKAVFLPLSVGGVPEVKTIFDLYEYWIDHLLTAFADSAG